MTSLKNYIIGFDFGNVGGAGQVVITLGEQIQFEPGRLGDVWLALQDGQWTQVAQGTTDMGNTNQTQIVVTGNRYQTFLNGALIHDFTYGSPVQGPVKVTILSGHYIDNFSLDTSK